MKHKFEALKTVVYCAAFAALLVAEIIIGVYINSQGYATCWQTCVHSLIAYALGMFVHNELKNRFDG